MKSVQIAGLLGQKIAHPVFCWSGKRPAEIFVNGAHRADRIASKLKIRNIKNALRRQSITLEKEFAERAGPVVHCFFADFHWIDRVAKDAAQDRNQTGDRSDRLDGRAMGLDEERVRIGREQCWQGKHVSGRFQDPAAPVFSFLQMLEKAPVKGVGWSQVLLQEPFSIAGHVVHGVELIAQKSRTHEADAFLGQVRTNGMELPKIRRHPL